MELKELMWGALDTYRERGGCKDFYVAPDNSVCLVGALVTTIRGDERRNLTSDEHRLVETAKHAMKETITELFPRLEGGVIQFNDHPKTTTEMCEQVLHKTALRVDEVITER